VEQRLQRKRQARGLVFVSGGYVKGGRAPGGSGLTLEYAINVEVLITFIPEVDDSLEPPESPKKDETNGETFSKKDETLGETKGVHARTSSCSSFSSSLAVPPAVTRAASDPTGESSPLRGDGKQQNLVVVAGAHGEINMETADFSLDSSAFAADLAQSAGGEKNKSNPKSAGKENLPLSDNKIVAQFEVVFDQVKSQAGKLWSERIIKRDIALESDAIFRTTARQCKDAADLYRALGGQVFALWEDFLITVDHAVDTSDYSPQRTWYLKDFIVWADRKLKTASLIEQRQEEYGEK
jgi:hypothetical protein